MSAQRRARLLGVALLAAAFSAGGLAGAAFERVLRADEPAPAAPADSTGAKETRYRRTPEILAELDLTPEQQARIDAVMERRKPQMDAFWEGEGRKLRAIVDSTRAEVREVLDAGQRVRYDSLRALNKKERERREGSPGSGPTPPASPPSGAP